MMDDEMIPRERELYEKINSCIMGLLPEAAQERVRNQSSSPRVEFYWSGQMPDVAAMYMIAYSKEDLSTEDRIESLEAIWEALNANIKKLESK